MATFRKLEAKLGKLIKKGVGVDVDVTVLPDGKFSVYGETWAVQKADELIREAQYVRYSREVYEDDNEACYFYRY